MGVGTVVILAVGIALAFDVVNGFHDSANSIATVVSTRVLSPRIAVIWAAFFNFVAYCIVDIGAADPAFVYVALAGLIGAITWNLLTWWWGLPSSSSHALIGGVIGSGVAYGGFKILVWKKIQLVL